jgi:CDP-diacylglycerol--glycerol-3-phosphate 3-phosphatidyltransferase
MVMVPPGKELEPRPGPRRPDNLFSLPNQLTLARFGLAVLLFALIAVESWLGCLVVFALASLTDLLDGYLARRLNLASALGRNLDPLADKVLVCGAFIFLLPRGIEGHWLLPWMVTVVVLRELLITTLRSLLEGQGIKFGADWLGKLKMWLQSAALVAIFIVMLRGAPPTGALDSLGWARDGFIYAMVVATFLSGLQYLAKAALLLRPGPRRS